MNANRAETLPERERRLERLKELKRSADPGLFDELEKCVDTEEQ
jgi:hypothetical protein